MISYVVPVSSLLLGISIALVGNGLLSISLVLRADLAEFGEAVTGFVMSGYFLGFVGGSFLCPGLIRRVGHIRSFATFAALGSASTLAYALLVDPWAWWLLRVVTGLALVGIYMVTESWLNARSPNDQRGRVFAAYMTVTLLALALGLYLASVAGEPGRMEPFVWSALFLTLGLVPVTLTRIAEPAPVSTPSPVFARLFRTAPFGTAGTLVAGVVNGTFWGLGPLFWDALGLSADHTAWFMALVIVGGGLLQAPVGHLSDRLDRRTVLVAVAVAGALVALATIPAAELSPWALAACAVAYGGAMLGIYSIAVAHVNDQLSAEEVLDATGTLLLLYGLGAAAGPLLAGPLMEAFGPLALALFSAAALGALGVLGVVRLLVGPPLPVEEQAPFVPMARTSQAALEMYPPASPEEAGEPEPGEPEPNAGA